MGKLINIKFSVNAKVENLVKLQDLNFYKYYKKAEQEKNKVVGIDDLYKRITDKDIYNIIGDVPDRFKEKGVQEVLGKEILNFLKENKIKKNLSSKYSQKINNKINDTLKKRQQQKEVMENEISKENVLMEVKNNDYTFIFYITPRPIQKLVLDFDGNEVLQDLYMNDKFTQYDINLVDYFKELDILKYGMEKDHIEGSIDEFFNNSDVFDKNVTDRELIDIFQDTMIVFIQENCKEMSQLSKTIRGLIKEQYPNLLDLGGDFRYYISGRYVSIMKVKRYKNVK